MSFDFSKTVIRVNIYPEGDTSLTPYWFIMNVGAFINEFTDWTKTNIGEVVSNIVLGGLYKHFDFYSRLQNQLDYPKLYLILSEVLNRIKLTSGGAHIEVVELSRADLNNGTLSMQEFIDYTRLETHREGYYQEDGMRLPSVMCVVSQITETNSCKIGFAAVWAGAYNGGFLHFNNTDNNSTNEAEE